jgi:hypothetical protein
MGVTTLQVNLNTEKMIDFSTVKEQYGYASAKGNSHYLSDDQFAGLLLKEKIAEQLLKGSQKSTLKPIIKK